MRNLKRVLALAMAMVMILGMMVIGSSAASYSDAAAIDEDYAVAVEVLSGMGIFKGTGAGFAPKQILTRAEAAALIYRVITGDTADKQVQNYDYASLKDIQAGQWYTGYVTYANNGGYIKGDDLGNFNPYAQVTGIQVMAIMLRAIGYGQNGEYEGAAWMDNILTDARELGITGDISTATLNSPATRELVAQLIFNAISNKKAVMVSYAPLLGYYKAKDAETLAEKVFGLTSIESADDWGRPATIWYNADKGVKKGTYATIEEEAVATHTVKTSQCDIAIDLGEKKTFELDVWTNGVEQKDVTFKATETKKTLGAQGTLIEVYEDRLVIIDTYLGQVTKVTDAKYDKADHLIKDVVTTIKVWDNGYNKAPTAGIELEGEDGYAKDAYVLAYYNAAEKYYEIVAEAESFEGAQDKIWKNASKHTIDDVDYMDAVHFYLDEAGTDDAKYTWFEDLYGNLIGAVEIEASYSYAVLKDIIWEVGRPGYAEATIVYMDGTEETVEVANADELIEDDDAYYWSADTKIYLDDQADTEFGGVSSDSKYNDDYLGYALYKVEYNKDGSVNLHGELDDETVVYYSENANIDTSASVILDLAYGEKVYVTTKTEFLVREGSLQKGYTYVAYDIDTLPEFEDNAEIFFTVDKKGIATRVYIKNATEEAEFGQYLFVTTDNYYQLTGRNAGKFTMSVVVDGVERDITTNEDTVKLLADNVGKLFYVDFDYESDSKYYGWVEGVVIVNEDSDSDWALEDANYLAHDITVTASSIIGDGVSYRFDDETVVIGDIDSIDELDQDVADAKGIWVIADETTRYGRADVIYVGTKLSADTDIKVAAEDATYDAKKATITLDEGETAVDVTVIVDDYNLIVVDDEVVAMGSYTFTDVAADDVLAFTVWAEDGCCSEDYEIAVVSTEAAVSTVVYKVNFWDEAGVTVQNTLTTDPAEIAPGTYVYVTDAAGVANAYDAAGLLAAVEVDAASWVVTNCTPKIEVVAGGSYTIVLDVKPVVAE